MLNGGTVLRRTEGKLNSIEEGLGFLHDDVEYKRIIIELN